MICCCYGLYARWKHFRCRSSVLGSEWYWRCDGTIVDNLQQRVLSVIGGWQIYWLTQVTFKDCSWWCFVFVDAETILCVRCIIHMCWGEIVPFYFSSEAYIIVVHVGFMKFQQTYCIENWINGQFLCCFIANSSRCLLAQNCWNRMWFHNVIQKIKLPIFWPYSEF